MNIKFLLCITVIVTVFAGDKGRCEQVVECVGNICNKGVNVVVAPLKYAKDYAEEYGRGQEALKQVEENKKQLDKKDEEIKKLFDSNAQKDKIIENQSAKLGPREVSPTERDLTKALSGIHNNQLKSLKNQKELNDTLKNGFDKITETSRLQQATQVVGAAVGVVYLVKSASEFAQWLSPSEEERARKENIVQRHKNAKIEQAFYKCLVDHEKSAKNEDEIPVKCEEEFKAFAAMIGPVESYNLKQFFKQTKK